MEILENDFLKIAVNPKGAELSSLLDKTTGTEYMWSGDAAFWNKHSPILFPIVGTLKNNAYFFQEKRYQLSRHGFARDMIFDVDKSETDVLSFSVSSTEQTMLVFPFPFRLEISYQLTKKKLTVGYRVANTGEEAMYFSIGGHPAFKLPIEPGSEYEDYYLEFEQHETASRWPISREGLIETTSVPLLNGRSLRLTKELFRRDALVFKDLNSSSIQLKSDKTDKGFQLDFPYFPFLGIWAAKDADFVCLEPWCGIADGVDTNQELTEKEGIQHLVSGQDFKRQWSIAIFG